MDIFATPPAPLPDSPEGQDSVFQADESEDTVQAVLDSANQHYNEALTLAHTGKLDEAIAQLQAAISLASNQPNFYNLLGTCYAQKGLYSEAVETWKRTIALDPELDRAFKSIEKARRFEGEAVEEHKKRPYMMTLVGLGVACVFLLLVTAGLGWKSLMMRASISSLTDQVANLEANIDGLNQQLLDRVSMADYKEREARVQEMLGQLSEKDERIRQLERERDQIQQDRLRQVTELEGTISAKNNEIATYKAGEVQLTQAFGDIAKLEQENEGLNTQLQQIKEMLDNREKVVVDLNEQIRVLNAKLDQTRDQMTKQREDLMVEKDQAIAAKNSEILGLKTQLIDYNEKLKQVLTANQVLRQALAALDNNEFTQAQGYIQNALSLDPENLVGKALKSKVEGILNDPFQRELLMQNTLVRDERNLNKRVELIADLIQRGDVAFRSGIYADAAGFYRRALSLQKTGDPSNPAMNEAAQSKVAASLNKSEEAARRIGLQIDEARREQQNGNIERARELIGAVLKESPNHLEAKELKDQLK